MVFSLRLWTQCALLALGVKGACGSATHQHYPYQNVSISTTYDTVTSCSTTELPSITVSSISTTTYENSTTTTIVIPTNITSPTTISTTIISPTTITTTTTTPTTTTPTTVTSLTTITPTTLSTSVFNPCPTTCSISAGTVDLFYWPTDNDYVYPSTYVDTRLDYTFTSPSVYMVINTIYGYNSLGRAGPAASSPIFALNIDQVSSIVPGEQATRQLELSDLGTDCPHSLDPSVIATKAPDGRCDPSLVAPDVVKSWALPCNACGKFGLFDPPYAVPTLGGGLIETTETITATEPDSTILAPTTTTTPPATGASSTVVEPTITATVPDTTGSTIASTSDSSVESTIDSTATTLTESSELTPTSDLATSTPVPVTTESSPVTTESPGITTESSPLTTGDPTAIPSSASSDPTGIVTASATKVTGGLSCLVLGLVAAISLM